MKLKKKKLTFLVKVAAVIAMVLFLWDDMGGKLPL